MLASGRPIRSTFLVESVITLFCWTKLEKLKFLGPELFKRTTEKIIKSRQRMGKTLCSTEALRRSEAEVKPQCYAKEPLSVPLDGLHFDDKLQFVEEPVEIMDREVKRLKRSRIPLIKVRWNSKRGPEFTWEREDQFEKKYPHLFTKTAPSSSAASRSVSIRCQGYIGDFVLGCHAKDMVALYSVMSDSDESRVTYTEVSSTFEDLSDIGSPRADDQEYLELPRMLEDPYLEAALQAPPSPDYVPGPEEPEQAPPLPDYVPGPEHTDDEISDPEADPEEDDDEDPEEDPFDYPIDRGDDGDDEEGSSKDDEDDDIDIEADDEEEEEHLAPVDSVVVALLATDQAPSAKETEPFETDESAATPPPHPAYRVTARISIPAPVPTPVWSDAEVARLLAISTPPSSPLSPWSSPLPQIPSPSLPLSPPSPVLSPAPPPSPIRSLGYRAAMIWMRAEAASTSHSLPLPPPFILSPTRPDAPSLGIPPPLPISVPTSSPPLLLPSASRREDRPEVTLPPRKRLGIALGPGYEVGESSSAAARPAGGLRADYGFVATMDREIRCDPEREVRYGITNSWDEIVETLQGAPVSTDTELGRHMTAFETRVRQDTNEVYTRLDDEQSHRQLLAGRLNMLFRDRRAHAYTRHQMETEARLSREAWRRSMDASDLARGEDMSLCNTVLGQMSEIRELHDADRRRHAVTSEMLKADHRRSAEMRELRTADHTRQ
ncbi:hypothetical protein Tco_0773515 [Tanacetum coccineum]|uniref:Reverse transcriptase domain-containing protein n=1 Tax=Tanacetum coccineum TaxID=301880 RepID=A0ABQ4ZL29_9ASTR